jgi:hypothetical protein
MKNLRFGSPLMRAFDFVAMLGRLFGVVEEHRRLLGQGYRGLLTIFRTILDRCSGKCMCPNSGLNSLVVAATVKPSVATTIATTTSPAEGITGSLVHQYTINN